jgi:hypothetical protein
VAREHLYYRECVGQQRKGGSSPESWGDGEAAMSDGHNGILTAARSLVNGGSCSFG